MTPLLKFLRTYVMEILIALIAAAVLYSLLTQGYECSQRGGDFVRGVFWYKCL